MLGQLGQGGVWVEQEPSRIDILGDGWFQGRTGPNVQADKTFEEIIFIPGPQSFRG